MRKSLLLLFAFVLSITTYYSCSKKTGFDDLPGNQYPPVFDSYSAAGNAVSNYLQQHSQGEQLLRIEHIVYLESGNKTYALVYYETNLGHSNILYEREYQGQQLLAGKHYKCTGSNCDCKVTATVDTNGNIEVDCTCSSCTMEVNSF